MLLGGCDRTMGTSDGISAVAGIAPRSNLAAQTINPFAGQLPGPNPGGDGGRVAAVIDSYRAGIPAGPADTAPDDAGAGEGVGE